MNIERTLTSALVVAVLSLAAVPAGAQERRDNRHERNGGRATARAQGPRQDDGQRAAARGRDNAPRGSYQQRAVPRSSDRPAYRGNDRRQYAPPSRSRSYSSRPYYYSRPYVRPFRYVPYRPFYFARPYYSFRPRLNIGFGLWIGDPVPYPYAYLGTYSPRVYGYYPEGSYRVTPGVPVYGGVSFDIQPSDADLFVDGEYVGPIGNFTTTSEPLTLTPGVHRIAVQRDGFRSMEWDATIEPGQVIPYRGAMDRF